MARIARVVVPGLAHHTTQRGNRRQQTFFRPDDYQFYLRLLSEWCAKSGVEIWAYCLMPNHVHLIAVPRSEESLRRAIGETHRRFSRFINSRQKWQGYLWQGRFASFPMDNKHLLAATRYVELNPVAAGMVAQAEDYPWSSAAAHLRRRGDPIVNVEPLLKMVPNWMDFLNESANSIESERIEYHERTGRPMGDESFISNLEKFLNRSLQKGKPGRPRLPEKSVLCPQIY